MAPHVEHDAFEREEQEALEKLKYLGLLFVPFLARQVGIYSSGLSGSQFMQAHTLICAVLGYFFGRMRF